MDYGSTQTSQASSRANSIRSVNSTPRELVIISNTKRSSRQTVLLNPKTIQDFKDLLTDFGSMIDLTYPPATALFTAEPPYINVESYSQLLREFKHTTVFIVCGREGIPKEISQPEPDTPRMYPKHSYLQQFRASKQKHVSPPIERWEDVEMSMAEVTPQPHNYDYEIVRADINGQEHGFYCPKRLRDRQDPSKPAKRLKLDWVYGLNAFSKNPLHVLSTGELVYYVSNIAVVYDRKKETQRFFTAHTSPICCIALHPDNLQPYIASGQSLEPLVRIWDARSMATYSVVGEGILQGNVTSLQLSSSGLLLIVDSFDKHTLSIWDWQNNELLVRTMVSLLKCFFSSISYLTLKITPAR